MIVTELMHQGSLKSVVERAPLSTDKVFKYAVEIAEGMIFLHSFDIIHRDLKSENVLVSALYWHRCAISARTNELTHRLAQKMSPKWQIWD